MEIDAIKKLLKRDKELSRETHDTLVSLVKDKGGFIDTRNLDSEHDSIYAVIYNEGYEQYQEEKIAAIATFENELCILPQERMSCDWEDATPEEMLEDANWESIYGGMCWINASLTSIAECIEQYV